MNPQDGFLQLLMVARGLQTGGASGCLLVVFVYLCICVSECDIRMDFDTNEYPNIFVSRK